jgi:hypothetical protein
MTQMEIASLTISAIGLAGLVPVGSDVLKTVESYRNFCTESRLLKIRFDLNKAIFPSWAKRVGIVSSHAISEAQHHPLLDDAKICTLVHRTLLCIGDIFSAMEGSQGAPDLPVCSDQDSLPLPQPGTGLPTTPAQPATIKKPHSGLSLSARKVKLKWASGGGKDRFVAQVEAFDALLEQLHTLVPPVRIDDNGKTSEGKFMSKQKPILYLVCLRLPCFSLRC